MDLQHYFDPVDFERFEIPEWTNGKHTFGGLLQKNSEKLTPEKADLLLIGIEEDRNAVTSGAAKAPDTIRKYLYNLNRIGPRLKTLDLGNLRPGRTVSDTYFALRDICEQVLNGKKTLVVMGGSQDLTFGMSKAFDERSFNMVTVDPKPDLRKGIKTVNSENYLNLVAEKQKSLYALTILAYQNYLVDATEIDQINQLQWEARRLGQIRYDLSSVEPILRNAHLFSFDLNSVRFPDAAGQATGSPNGLYSEEACQIARYAGISDELKLAGFFNLIPDLDPSGNSAHLMAQIIWHFIEGFYNRKPEDPLDDSDDFNQLLVDMSDIGMTLVFFQSRLTNRWWMEISDYEDKDCEMLVIPCDEDDYKKALQGEIPDRWWKNVRKLQKK
jgi:arginase family enzyme